MTPEPDARALLSARGLRLRYLRRVGPFARPHAVQALDGVNIDVREASTLALVGQSGSGKSTLARCLARLEEPDSGRILLEGTDLLALRGAELRRARGRVQLVFQDPARALNPRLSALEIAAEPILLREAVSRREREGRALALLEEVGLRRDWAARRPFELSGGQRQRLALARALAARPKLLILDEALSGLDPSLQAQMVNLLLALQAEHGLGYLVVSHDLGLAAHVAERVAVMQAGRIVEEAAAAELFRAPRHPHTRALLAALPGAAGALA